ncbi:zinc-dependent metalloprotease [Kitasatospora sp. NPDC098652]|uniref:zinc-dependent metalloprotease n=1 Tax=Kitasatospora sp. NPDC098652 TaxID=3364095 RepID=UPI003803ADEE
MSDLPFGFGVPPEEPEDGKAKPDDAQKKKEQGQEGTGGAQPFGFGTGNPFGAMFGLPGTPGGPGGAGADNPFAAMFGGLNPGDLGAAFQQLGQMLSFEGGPVNWELAQNIARQTVVAEPAEGKSKDRSVGDAERSAVVEAVRLADLWLDGVTEFPSGAGTAVAWSRAEWIEATLPVWKDLVDPVAEQVGNAMGGVLPEEMQAMAGPLMGMMRSMGGAMFGTQIGQALGALAGEVVGSTDVGLPLAPAGKAALLPQNVAEFGEGLNVPADEVRLYLALREAAHQRLFAHVPWLRAHLLGAVEAYARGIKVDTSRMEELVGQLDPGNPEALQEALAGGLLQPEDTPAQKAALARLETALALVEGWVDAVVHAAAEPHLPQAGALRETVRRRRAAGGPAEQTFATLVGLELRPRRLRDAARLWALLADARGIEGRDALWEHPDMLPTAADLDDPDAFVHRGSGDLEGGFDFDALDKLLGEAAAGKPDLTKNDPPKGDAPKGDTPNGDAPKGDQDGTDGKGEPTA